MGDVVAQFPIPHVELKAADSKAVVLASNKLSHRGSHLGIGNDNWITQDNLKHMNVLKDKKLHPITTCLSNIWKKRLLLSQSTERDRISLFSK